MDKKRRRRIHRSPAGLKSGNSGCKEGEERMMGGRGDGDGTRREEKEESCHHSHLRRRAEEHQEG